MYYMWAKRRHFASTSYIIIGYYRTDRTDKETIGIVEYQLMDSNSPTLVPPQTRVDPR